MSMDRRRAINVDPSDSRALRNALGRFATGVTIVTANTTDGPKAIAANSFSAVSLEPPLVLWSIARTSRRYRYFEAAEHYAIHILSVSQADLCHAVARDADALCTLDLAHNAEDVPLLPDSLARFECRKYAAHAAGDHEILLGEILRSEMLDGAALTFYGGKYGRLDDAR